MQHTKPHTDIAGRVVGILILFGGIAMLGFVFSIAADLFQHPVKGLEFVQQKGAALPPSANIGTAVIVFVMKLFALGLMTWVGSLIASKGIETYFAAASHSFHRGHRDDHAVTPETKPATTAPPTNSDSDS